MDKIILNLGSGNNPMPGCINVDSMKGEGVDEVEDLTQLPWKWKDGTIDKIWLIHVLEHFQDPKGIIQECHRILKRGGELEIIVPHSTSAMSIGCLGHYRTYSYDTLNDYLCRPFYYFKEKLFETTFQELRWWYGKPHRPVTNVPKWMLYGIIFPMNWVINRLIKLSPQVFENGWCYWVGGAKEVCWRGVKV